MGNIKDRPPYWAGRDWTVRPENAEVSTANGTAGSIPLMFRTSIPDAATGDVSIVTEFAVRVIDFWIVKQGGAGAAGNTIQLKSAGNAITDALDANVADKAVVRAATIDDAQHELAAGGELRVTRTKAGGNAQCIAYTLCVKV